MEAGSSGTGERAPRAGRPGAGGAGVLATLAQTRPQQPTAQWTGPFLPAWQEAGGCRHLRLPLGPRG